MAVLPIAIMRLHRMAEDVGQPAVLEALMELVRGRILFAEGLKDKTREDHEYLEQLRQERDDLEQRLARVLEGVKP